MIILNVQQGTDEWKRARIGVPTASCFDEILTPSGARSGQQDKYLARLAAEWFFDEPFADEARTQFMERGTDMEPEAGRWYAFERDCDPVQVGLCLTDDGRVGASPDLLVGSDGAAEIKCPGAKTHMLYLLGGTTGQYRVQTQGQLMVLERRWVDLVLFHPTLPKEIRRSERDEKFIALLGEAVIEFVGKLEKVKARFAEEREAYLSRKPKRRPKPESDPDPFCTIDTGGHPHLAYAPG